MSEWAKKIKDEARGLFAEAEQELTALEGVDTVDLTEDPDTELDDADTGPSAAEPVAQGDPVPEDGADGSARDN